MNSLDVAFDHIMNWQMHIENTTTKAKRAPKAIELTGKHFNKSELLNLITSKQFSVLYYCSEI